MKQRCENPHDQEYPNYGGRGIQWRFPSVLSAGLWILETFPEIDRNLEIDRADTNGHYEKGNIRFVTKAINLSNKRNTVLTHWDSKYWPYARSVVTRKLSAGLTREEIIQDAETAVFEKRKNWRGIARRLEFMTYEMPESITVLPYRGNSSTTVDTAAR